MASKEAEELCELISNWLARQIAEAKIEEHGEQCDCRYEDGEFHPCPRREELDCALSATKLESGK